MPNLRSMPESELPLGDPLPWDLYDRWGDLLLKQGGKIRDEDQLREILVRGPSVLAPENPDDGFHEERTRLLIGTPFDVSHKCIRFLDRITRDPFSIPTFPSQIEAIANAILRAVDRDEDASIATLVMMEEGRYAIRHHVETAFIVAVMGRSMELAADTLRNIVCAALTMNISNIEMHESLHADETGMSDSTRILMNLHPQQGANMLTDLGVASKEWIESVRRHHELWDGSGYPHGLIGSRIPLGGQMIQIADTYAARTSARSWKSREHSNATLADLVRNAEGKTNPDLCKRLIRILGIYTPGTWVTLDNAEIALVVRHGKNLKTPMVLSFISRGLALGAPLVRDTSVERFACRAIAAPPPLDHVLKPNVLWGLVLPTP